MSVNNISLITLAYKHELSISIKLKCTGYVVIELNTFNNVMLFLHNIQISQYYSKRMKFL